LSSNVSAAPAVPTKRNQTKANFMVGGCTLLGAAAQLLIKHGLNNLPLLVDPALGSASAQLPLIAWKILSNLPLFGGLCLYGMSTGLLVLALRYGELSVLYPIIALTYVWVSLLSVTLLGESMNPYKALGLAIIVCGVTILGRGPRKPA
jgi:multidrug transporter EmrE-like cation transporter